MRSRTRQDTSKEGGDVEVLWSTSVWIDSATGLHTYWNRILAAVCIFTDLLLR